MTDEDRVVANLAEQLRHAFDRSFAELPSAPETDLVDLLAVRVAGRPYAIALSEITGLFLDRTVAPLPATAPEFLGVASLRGDVVPVYSLCTMLGDSGGDECSRWLAVAGSDRVAAFAFDHLDTHFRVPTARIAPVQADAQHRHFRATIVEGEARPIISMRSLLDEIERKAAPVAGRGED